MILLPFANEESSRFGCSPSLLKQCQVMIIACQYFAVPSFFHTLSGLIIHLTYSTQVWSSE